VLEFGFAQDLADAIADMRAIGEGTVTEYSFKKWWFKNCSSVVMPHSFTPVIVEAISSVSTESQHTIRLNMSTAILAGQNGTDPWFVLIEQLLASIVQTSGQIEHRRAVST
jgi:hypothetical protein